MYIAISHPGLFFAERGGLFFAGGLTVSQPAWQKKRIRSGTSENPFPESRPPQSSQFPSGPHSGPVATVTVTCCHVNQLQAPAVQLRCQTCVGPE